MICFMVNWFLNSLGIRGRWNRDRVVRLFVALGSAIGALLAMTWAAQFVGVDMAPASAFTAVIAAVCIIAYKRPVQGILSRLGASVLARPAAPGAYVDPSAAALLSLTVAVLLRAVQVSAARLASALVARLHVVHICVLPACVSTALVAAQRQLGAGVQPA